MNQPLSDLARRDSIRVLYVEDDTNCREAIAGELSDRGFVVRSFADAASLLDGLDIATGADIIVLDRRLPDVSGIDLLAQLRQSGMSLPVVFLLATLLAPGNASRSIEAPSTSSARLVAWRFWSSVRRLLETAKSAASPRPIP